MINIFRLRLQNYSKVKNINKDIQHIVIIHYTYTDKYIYLNEEKRSMGLEPMLNRQFPTVLDH